MVGGVNQRQGQPLYLTQQMRRSLNARSSVHVLRVSPREDAPLLRAITMISVLIRIAELLQCPIREMRSGIYRAMDIVLLDQQSLLLHKLRVLTIVLKVLQVSNELNFVIKEDGGDLRGFVRIRDKDLEDMKGSDR